MNRNYFTNQIYTTVRKNVTLSSVISVGILFVLPLIYSCKKKDEYTAPVIPTTVPVLTTKFPTKIKAREATTGGVITSNGGAEISELGVCWDTQKDPTINNNRTIDYDEDGRFESKITGLQPFTTYYIRAYATNNAGTAYGNVFSMRTFHEWSGETVSDIEGNMYRVVTINQKKWIADNLKTSRLNDGTQIQNILSGDDWKTTEQPAYCYQLNNLDSLGHIYGMLYNWHAVGTGKLCPSGWRVPSKDEYFNLIIALNPEYAGGKLRDVDNNLWAPPNTCATNESLFSAFPAGLRDFQGYFSGTGSFVFFWTRTKDITNTKLAHYLSLLSNICEAEVSFLGRSHNFGMPVRCLKDL
jgi:uncharacterized protein (TIGR02145 family)